MMLNDHHRALIIASAPTGATVERVVDVTGLSAREVVKAARELDRDGILSFQFGAIGQTYDPSRIES